MSSEKTGGVLLIILAITLLWAFNTGRLEALFQDIVDPNFRKTNHSSSSGGIGSSGGNSSIPATPGIGGGIDWGAIIGGIGGIFGL